MNILTAKLPTKVMIDDTKYELNTDFRPCLKTILAFEDESLTDDEKVFVTLKNLYKEIPSNVEKAFELAVKFLDCGESQEIKKVKEGIQKRIYHFGKDSKYMYSAFKQTHNVDLETIDYLHFWKFVYMFLDLNENCMFRQLIYLRSQKNKGKLTKEEKKLWWELREIVDLDYTEEEEEDSEFMQLLNGKEVIGDGGI